jgi:phosphatidylglycerol:prolipoprotein diacylglycerol transferase
MPFVHDIDPIALQIGPLAIRWYGLTYLAAGITAFMLGRKRAGEIWRGFRREEIEDIIFYGMIGVIVGGRLGSVFFYHFSDFLKDPLMLVRVWEGGMSFHGGLLGVLVAVGWYARKTGRAVFAIYDFVAPVVPIGLGFGRLGNYVGGELWGHKTDLPWGVIFPNALAGPALQRRARSRRCWRRASCSTRRAILRSSTRPSGKATAPAPARARMFGWQMRFDLARVSRW